MQDPGILELLAELGIAVLGFSGIIVVLGQRSPGDWNELDRFRFSALLYSASGVVVLSLLPFPLISAGASQASVWGWSSGLGATFVVIIIVLLFKRVGVSQIWSNPDLNQRFATIALVATLASLSLLVLNATGIRFERTLTQYLIAVLLLLASSLISFTRMLQIYLGRPD